MQPALVVAGLVRYTHAGTTSAGNGPTSLLYDLLMRARRPRTENLTMLQYLSSEVESRNRVNAAANSMRDDLIEALKPYRGRKVLKMKPYRTWTLAVKPVVDSILEKYQAGGIRAHFQITDYSIFVNLSVDYPVGNGGVQYVKADAYVGTVDGDKLSPELKNFERLRSDFTESEVRQGLEKISALESEIRQIRSSLFWFVHR